MSYPRRGEIYLVSLDPTIGSEIKKTRPAVIIQNDVGNQYSSTTIVAPISGISKVKRPIDVLVKAPEGGLDKDSFVKLNQIRAVDIQRLGNRLGKLKPETLREVDEAIAISLGLFPL